MEGSVARASWSMSTGPRYGRPGAGSRASGGFATPIISAGEKCVPEEARAGGVKGSSAIACLRASDAAVSSPSSSCARAGEPNQRNTGAFWPVVIGWGSFEAALSDWSVGLGMLPSATTRGDAGRDELLSREDRGVIKELRRSAIGVRLPDETPAIKCAVTAQGPSFDDGVRRRWLHHKLVNRHRLIPRSMTVRCQW